ncbi:hypothetical protein GGS21DRAFT_489169 [Xylaria nigripes]|nr:hypothetical protein GGS21DRAFT_489169 [Xylaria nigripes]
MLPRSGGQKVYLEFTYTHPRFLALTLVAIQAILLGFMVRNCVIFSQYVFFAFDVDPTNAWRKALAVTLLTVISVVHVAFMGLVALYSMMSQLSSGRFDREPTISPGSADWDSLWQGSDWNFGTIVISLF